ncbi:MAG TPA: 3-hydroxyacyl-ACP dehydratase FabZ [Candidatus Omnitrophota bacterium]|nr:3-hydroxyacyl-ACP dehydratase FabZ [Candidatus Omnitrophota bacterium]HPN88746.1 3-hydroxyacyl-ACP dehydratase FabZ [Candidatus Omnitrophota bacterium]
MTALDIHQIKKILPHRSPILMIDRVTEIISGERAVAVKNITMNEEVFKGHFPNNPVFPGTWIVEAMAQTSIILYYTKYEKELKTPPQYYLGSIKSEFIKPVYPGDQLVIEAKTIKMVPQMALVEVIAWVGKEKVSKAELTFGIKR